MSDVKDLLSDLEKKVNDSITERVVTVVSEVSAILDKAMDDINQIKDRYLPSKTCIKCGESKPEDQYYLNGSVRRNECKTCCDRRNLASEKKRNAAKKLQKEEIVSPEIKLDRPKVVKKPCSWCGSPTASPFCSEECRLISERVAVERRERELEEEREKRLPSPSSVRQPELNKSDRSYGEHRRSGFNISKSEHAIIAPDRDAPVIKPAHSIKVPDLNIPRIEPPKSKKLQKALSEIGSDNQ